MTSGARWLVLLTALIAACEPTRAADEQGVYASEEFGADRGDMLVTDTTGSGPEAGESGGDDGEDPCALDVEGCAGTCPDGDLDALRILSLGDSVTRGRDENPSYRYYLHELLEAQGHSVNFVGTLRGAGGCCNNGESYDQALFPGFCDLDHEGHGGYDASEVLEEVPSWGADIPAVDLVLVMLGTVDALHSTPLDVTMTSMFELIPLVQELYPDVRIAIAPPIPASNPGMYASIVGIAEALPELTSFSTPGHEVVIVDMHEEFDIDTMLTPDGFHGNAVGDAFMAQRWFDTISAELPVFGW